MIFLPIKLFCSSPIAVTVSKASIVVRIAPTLAEIKRIVPVTGDDITAASAVVTTTAVPNKVNVAFLTMVKINCTYLSFRNLFNCPALLMSTCVVLAVKPGDVVSSALALLIGEKLNVTDPLALPVLTAGGCGSGAGDGPGPGAGGGAGGAGGITGVTGVLGTSPVPPPSPLLSGSPPPVPPPPPPVDPDPVGSCGGRVGAVIIGDRPRFFSFFYSTLTPALSR